ncbi:peptidyl-glycine alpha-amidating monooxygenase-like [Glandiceps talaboti]
MLFIMAIRNQAGNHPIRLFVSVLLVISMVQCIPYYDRPHRVDPTREEDVFRIDLLMPHVSPKQPDTYLCTSVEMPDDELYIVKYEPMASMNHVHHLILYGCEEPYSYKESWPCEMHTCLNGGKIIYAWARNAPELELPKDVGFQVGGEGHSKYLVLQLHYNVVDDFVAGATDNSGVGIFMTYSPQMFVAGIFLLVSMNVDIVPGENQIHSDVYCPYEERPRIHAFAFRVHTHTHGQVVAGYRIRNGRWSVLGKANPQWPQAFYPMEDQIDIQSGDSLAARCTFSGESVKSHIHAGPTSHDEMCNFYIMYYMAAGNGDIKQACSRRAQHIQFPADSDIPPLANQFLQDEMEQHQTDDDDDDGGDDDDDDHDDLYNLYEYYGDLFNHRGDTEDNIETATKPEKTTEIITNIDSSKDKEDENDKNQDDDKKESESEEDIVKEDEQTTSQPKNSKDEPSKDVYSEVEEWPSLDITLGQITAVDVDLNGDIVFFHRADRSWGARTFDFNNKYRDADSGAIDSNTIITVDSITGQIKHQWGSGLFYLPHGLTIDNDGNVWVTDVALHQVFKFPPGGSDSPVLQLGTKLEPGKDDEHFCKPTAVAVEVATGNFYVSDGYCNTRVIKYSKSGEKLFQWGKPTPHSRTGKGFPPPGKFNLPHGLALAEDKQQICVADRENGRVQCFQTSDGTFVKEYHPQQFDGRVYAIDYQPINGGLLYVVNGEKEKPGSSAPQAMVLQFDTGEVLETWQPKQGLSRPHDIAVSAVNSQVYICELDPHRLWKFVKGGNDSSVDPLKTKTLGENFLEEEQKPDALASTGDPDSGMVPTLVIMTLLAIPIALLALAIVLLRLRAQGKLRVHNLKGLLNGYRSTNHSVNLGSFFNRHKGFSKLNTEDNDLDGNNLSEDSDVDEYTAMNVNRNSQNL